MNDFAFVDIEKIDPTILLDIRYATTNNFVGKAVYPCSKCYLRKKVALNLQKVHQTLQKRGLGIKIYDGYRPLSVQKIFWNLLPDPRYIADPAIGSKHNRGASVDLTIVDAKGEEILMPTGFDDFSEKAFRDCVDLPEEAIRNRKLLEEVMYEQGFVGYPFEWWHFDDADWQSYPIVDVSFESLGC